VGLIAVTGHICVDFAPALPMITSTDPGALVQVGPMRLTLGGCVGNTATRLGELGTQVTVTATVGADELGDVVRAAVRERGLDDSGIHSSAEGATSYSLILEPQGKDRVIWHHPGANEYFDDAAVELDGVTLLHVGYPSLLPGLLVDDAYRLRRLLLRAHERDITTSADLAVIDRESAVARLDWPTLLARVLPLVDVLSPSIDDIASALPGVDPTSRQSVEDAAACLLEWGAAVVMISAGAQGMYVRSANEIRLRKAGTAIHSMAAEWSDLEYWQDPVPVERVTSTNGAGDAATAGLLAGIDAGMPPRSATWLAAASASASIERSTLTGLLPLAHHGSSRAATA
jgi:sugar/nucleoside kinase (ribokinase family)